jgi:hypothetical protein
LSMKTARRPQGDTPDFNDVIDSMLISEIFQQYGLSPTLRKSWVWFLEIIIIIIINIPWNSASVSSRFFKLSWGLISVKYRSYLWYSWRDEKLWRSWFSWMHLQCWKFSP